MNFLVKIWISFILDLIFGDPEKITHPVQIIGKMITLKKRKFYWWGNFKYVSNCKYISCYVFSSKVNQN